MKLIIAALTIAFLLFISSLKSDSRKISDTEPQTRQWIVDFFDDFDSFNKDNWQDQMLWVNNEDQCYVPDNMHNTREVSNGTLKIRVVDLGQKQACDNIDKFGQQHPDTQYVAGRIATKNLKEFSKGKWTARLKVEGSGQSGMFPAWWLLGARNNEPPVQEADENICWPNLGSGEIDIFEHHSDGGADHYAVRAIKSDGNCNGDWQSLMLVKANKLAEFHDYSVEWIGKDLVFRLDEKEIYRLPNEGDVISEPLFAILNFAKINDSAMTSNWTMEVDWVKHESIK